MGFYSLAYILGFIYSYWRIERLKFFSKIFLASFLDYIFFGVIIGARIFDCFVFQKNLDPLKIVQVWKGGMSFYGGVLGTAISCVVLAKRYEHNIWHIFAAVTGTVPFGLMLGRAANFINQELGGKAVTSPFLKNFFLNHPVQLYESFCEGFCLLIIMENQLRKNFNSRPKKVTLTFVLSYSLMRFLLEFFKETPQILGIFNLNQIFSGLFFSAGLFFWCSKYD